MGVQESLNQVIAELANRRIQLRLTGDPNLSSSLDGALIGTTVLQTDSVPQVIWRKLRAGANGWDVEQVLPVQPSYIRYVDQENTAPGQNGSLENPFSDLQDAYDSISSATSTIDFRQTYYVDVISELDTPVGDITLPNARSIVTLFSSRSVINGSIIIPVDGLLYPTIDVNPLIAFYSYFSDVPPMGSISGALQIAILGDLRFNKIHQLSQNKRFEVPLKGVAIGSFSVDGLISVPTNLTTHPFVDADIMTNNCSVYFGRDTGGGIYKAIDAQRSSLQSDYSNFLAETDVFSLVSESTGLLDLQIRHSGEYTAGAKAGLVNCDIIGTIVTAGRNLLLDNLTLCKAQLRMPGGVVFVTPNHINPREEYQFSNLDVDIVTSPELIDSFPYSLSNSCVWELEIWRGTTQRRLCRIGATWSSDGLTINTQGEQKLAEFGVTTDLSLAVDINSGNVRLRATAVNTNDWAVSGRRVINFFRRL